MHATVEAIQERPRAVETASRDIGLKLRNVTKRFGNTVAVSDISLTAHSGEVHALLGENGAGKSTLMAIASGDLHPDQGTVEIDGKQVESLSVAQVQQLGLAIVHQHPAILPDLTVAENLLLAVPKEFRPKNSDSNVWVEEQLRRVGATFNAKTQASDLNFVQLQLVELAKAFAINPSVLVLDEPTAALTSDLVEVLFQNIRELRASGTAIIYISHRLQEVREIADVVTVIRDGALQKTAEVSELSDNDILRFIVGRDVNSVFPPKSEYLGGSVCFQAQSISGAGLSGIDVSVHEGEIVGLAGIAGNGQNEFLRALAGLENARGEITLDGKKLQLGKPGNARSNGIVFLSSDRPNEGAFLRQSVRENASIAALSRLARFGFINQKRERAEVQEQRHSLGVKTASVELPISTLSGGNQQKVILARALLARPSLVLAEEPTAGVDMGARAEIYQILRKLAKSGTPVIVMSSDLVELEGLCDRVYVFSRGQVTRELERAEVSEEEIGFAMVTASDERKSDTREETSPNLLQRTLGGRYTPSIVLALLIIGLTAYVTGQNGRFVSAFNIEKMLFLSAALAFVGFGQLCTILTGRIDLSVGPLVGLTVVIASFHFSETAGIFGLALGFAAILAASLAVGAINGGLVWFGGLSAVAVTLGVYILIQGTSVLLRPFPDGVIGPEMMGAIQSTIGFVPVLFVAALSLGLLLELLLQKSRAGMALRAVGSDESAARHIGVPAGKLVIGAFLASSVFTALGGFVVVGQLGIGDPNQGVEYTLASIAAVVLGGASLAGGRGSFIGVLLGAVLIQVINSSMVFLGLSQAWQFWFIGLLTLGAVALYSKAENAGR